MSVDESAFDGPRGRPRGACARVCIASGQAPLLRSGCGLTDWAHNGLKVGPEYRRPPAVIADYWIDAGDAHLVESVSSDPQWWSTLNDPVLDSLIQSAYGQNLTLREAGWRVMQARAARAIAVGNFFPQSQQAFGQYERLESESLRLQYRCAHSASGPQV